jgi:hypothetical protein
MRVLALIVGILCLIGVTSSVVRTLVVPRGLRSFLANTATMGTIGTFRVIGRRIKNFEARDRLLAWSGPLSILVILLVWLFSYLISYSLISYGVSTLSVADAVQETGSALVALTYIGVHRAQLTVLDMFAAVTGPIVIALLIGYLPTMYGAYNRRETDVTMLLSRAGEPNWGPTILARHAMVDTVSDLDEFFRGWERWAADISESHTNYPTLIFVRSARPLRNWLIGLLSVMDAAAMQLALTPSLPQGPARLAVRMGFVCMRDLATVLRIPFDADPDPDTEITLTFEDFLEGISKLESQGFPMDRTPEEAWPHFRGWRVNYESIAYAIAWQIDAVPAPWSGPRATGDAPIMPISPVNRQPGGSKAKGTMKFHSFVQEPDNSTSPD